ncbi:MAG: HDOD domain-containing protein [Gammaproteobacteria bacterium]|nr:HDOD domain-containing protein [Gammaproteobacteria bacterium]
MNNIYIARQPIYDSAIEIIGYELLYRDSESNMAEFTDGKTASSETIVNSFIHIGIDNLAGTSLAFVNLPTEFILDNALIPMFHEQSVLEILEEVEPSQEVISGVKRLKEKGYKIALDDFVYSEKIIPMLELADFVKIDVLDYQQKELAELISLLKKHHKVKLIAEKVETNELFLQCKTLDFDYYQGYFFCYPQMVVQKKVCANKMVVMSLITEILKPETEIQGLEDVLSRDVTLTYKLLRYINSAAFSLRREIESIKDAIVLLGLDSIKNWASLILISKLNDDKPDQLITTALQRAKMVELIARNTTPELEKQAFICGLFSVLDALMDKPMIDLLDTVILSTPIKLALLDYEGELGELLKNCILYERAEFDKLDDSCIKTKRLNESYLTAVKWADTTIRELKN